MTNYISLNVDFPEKKVLSDFSISFPENGVACLFGPSGCGKTTLLNVISGVLDGGVKEDRQKTISYLFQENRLLPWFSASVNLEILFKTNKKESAKKYLEMLSLVGEENTPVTHMSGGMQRRVAIAKALAIDADIYILDEPFKGFDPALKKSIMDLFIEIAKTRLVILVTHNISDALIMSDIIFLLSGPPLKIEKKLMIDAESYPKEKRSPQLFAAYQKEMEKI